ncbi:MAG: T9SS C-terminal target domain-containing protein [Bacteroidetes bacterium]|nr:T9SS C-terminal target domain-containing protein [Bacteroidota bacterium]
MRLPIRLSYFRTTKTNFLKRYAMKIKFSLLFYLLFGQLAAQTFEKTYHINSDKNYIHNVWIDDQLNSYFTIKNGGQSYDSLYFTSQPFFLKIDVMGNQQMVKQIVPSSLDSNFIDSINHLDIQITIDNGNGFDLYGSIRKSFPYDFNGIHLKTNYNFDVLDKHYFVTKQDSSIFIKDFFVKNDTLTFFGSLSAYNNGIDFGHLFQVYQDSLIYEKSLFNDRDSIYTSNIFHALKDKNGHYYTFSDGYFGPPNFFLTFMQINKLDSNFQPIQKQIISLPSKPFPNDSSIVTYATDVSWVTDSTFIIAYALYDNIDTKKGDVHLFLYDTSLKQLNYKRINSIDTNQQSIGNSLVYDSISGYYYFGTTQSLKKFKYSNPFNTEDPTAFRLIKFDKNLNVKWEKVYYNQNTIQLENLTSDKNGNITMAGTLEDSVARQNGDRYIYVLRVDSLGNYIRSNINERKNIDKYVAFYPNPFKESINLLKLNYFVPYKVEIVDALGRSVYQCNWSNDKMNISTRHWQSGMYFYIVKDSYGNTTSGKLLKLK